MSGSYTATGLAVHCNNRAGLRFLAGAGGVDVSAAGDPGDGETPCQIACRKGHPDSLQVLLALGAEPNRTDENGFTPCMVLAMSPHHDGSVASLRALAAGGPGGKLEGAAVNAVNSDGMTALDMAETNQLTELAAVLRDELGGKRAADL